ncbi:MAG: hypothetical protein V2I63_05115 [Pseudomonadales bacterium]|jgi:hypothetical protein|nr:hypothetical protein [Pseudomonadales bacterium]
MAGPYDIAQRHLDAAVSEASAAGIDGDRLGKAMFSQLLRFYLTHRSAADIRSEIAFELDHLEGDQDIPFMRP